MHLNFYFQFLKSYSINSLNQFLNVFNIGYTAPFSNACFCPSAKRKLSMLSYLSQVFSPLLLISCWEAQQQILPTANPFLWETVSTFFLISIVFSVSSSGSIVCTLACWGWIISFTPQVLISEKQ